MKVIFLDLDGPICDTRGNKNLDAIYRLSELVRLTKAKIIITSSWRIGKDINQLTTSLSLWLWYNFPVDQVIGMTEVIYHNGREIPRGAEIEIYLEDHQDIDNYVILDDESVPLLTQADHFVQTERDGITGEQFREALRILG